MLGFGLCFFIEAHDDTQDETQDLGNSRYALRYMWCDLHPQLLKQELILVAQVGLKLLVPCLLIAVDYVPLCATLLALRCSFEDLLG